MKKRMITDAEGEQLLAGTTPEGRPELSALAASVAAVRVVSTAAAPQPSAALAARLESPVPVGAVADAQPARGIRKMVATIAGLGVAAKVAAASGVLALGLVGVGAAGAAGALPAPAQQVFDDVIETVIVPEDDTLTEGEGEGVIDECVVEPPAEGTDGSTDGDGTTACVDPLPVGSKEFSDWVREGAQDPNKVGREFGQAVSEQARELREEKAEERAESGQGSNGNGNGRGGQGDDDTEGDTDVETEESGHGSGKPEGTPGGGRP
ncbi:MAG: hypothetical protein ACO1N6_10755 [Microcella sp.]